MDEGRREKNQHVFCQVAVMSGVAEMELERGEDLVLKTSAAVRRSIVARDDLLKRMEALEKMLSVARGECVRMEGDFEDAWRQMRETKRKYSGLSVGGVCRGDGDGGSVRRRRLQRVRVFVAGMATANDGTFCYENTRQDFVRECVERCLVSIIKEIPWNSESNKVYAEFHACPLEAQQHIVRFLQREVGLDYTGFLEFLLEINGLDTDGGVIKSHPLHCREAHVNGRSFRVAKKAAAFPKLCMAEVREHKRRRVYQSTGMCVLACSDSEDEYPNFSGDANTEVVVDSSCASEAQSVVVVLEEDDDETQDERAEQYRLRVPEVVFRSGPRFEFCAEEGTDDWYTLPAYMCLDKKAPAPLQTVYPAHDDRVLHVANNTQFGRQIGVYGKSVLHQMESHYIDALHCKVTQVGAQWKLHSYGYFGLKIGDDETLKGVVYDLNEGDIVTFDNVASGKSQFVYRFCL